MRFCTRKEGVQKKVSNTPCTIKSIESYNSAYKSLYTIESILVCTGSYFTIYTGWDRKLLLDYATIALMCNVLVVWGELLPPVTEMEA